MDERLHAVERVRIASGFFLASSLMTMPVGAALLLDLLGVSFNVGFGTEMAVGMGAFFGVLLLAVPAYLLLLPARWFARANRMRSVWLASVLFAAALAAAVAIAAIGYVLRVGLDDFGGMVVFSVPPVLGVGASGLLSWGLARLYRRRRDGGVLVVLVCMGLVTVVVGLGVVAVWLSFLDWWASAGGFLPLWYERVLMWIAGSVATLPLVLAVGSVAGLAGTHRLVTRIVREGECPECGYDLRGLKGGGVCPECGWGRKRRSEERRRGESG